MKLKAVVLVTAIAVVGLITYFVMKPVNVSTESAPLKNEVKESAPLKDGVYEGKTRSIYESEGLYGMAKVYIENGKMSKVEFQIFDTWYNEVFDEKYAKHFVGNEYYIEQCRNDWKGVQTYPVKLMETGNLDEVDAIAGATWSYNLFKDSVLQALEKARK
jgi:major membrane immunogen (membrane-anchored lipoprotein)